jgi:hypothetical protein
MPNLVTLFNNEKKKFTDVQSQEPITDGKRADNTELLKSEPNPL